MMRFESNPTLTLDARQEGARTAGSRVRLTKDGRVLYASRGFALVPGTEDPETVGREARDRGL